MVETTTVRLPGSGHRTSRLGFGTAGLAGELTHKESIALLETAFDVGIRHFDTAPLYGAGASEKILGDFVTRRGREITLTTKFGFAPPHARSLLLFGKGLLRPLLRRIPGLKSGLARSTAVLNRRANYTPESMRRSLSASLRALGVGHIDLLLMHEAEASDLHDDIRRALDAEVKSGRIGAWGVGAGRNKIDQIFARVAHPPRVLQFEWSVFADRSAYPQCFCILYGSISTALPQFRMLLTPDRQRSWSNKVGLDLADARVLPGLLVTAALAANPDGIVLFSSKKPERIRDIALAVEPRMLQAAAKLLDVLRAEPACVVH